jgi:NADH dehydrogenase/NADH:ubiquinone oxidoreductase subunit G
VTQRPETLPKISTWEYEADLIYTDIDYHSNKLKNIFNKSLKAAVLFYKYHFDPEYFETTYQLLREKINSILKDKKTIIISNLKRDTNYENENIVLDYSNYHNTEGGLVNHFSEKGNQEIYQNLIKILNSLK